MKRTALFLLSFFLLFSLISCKKDETNENVHAFLALPMKFDCAFSLGELDGCGTVNLTEDAFNLGITDGSLKGLVVSVSNQNARFLYQGMDVTFSAATTKKFSEIRRAFAFLREQHFKKDKAALLPNGYLFTFTDEQETTIEYSVTTDGAPCRLVVSYGETPLTLDFT